MNTAAFVCLWLYLLFVSALYELLAPLISNRSVVLGLKKKRWYHLAGRIVNNICYRSHWQSRGESEEPVVDSYRWTEQTQAIKFLKITLELDALLIFFFFFPWQYNTFPSSSTSHSCILQLSYLPLVFPPLSSPPPISSSTLRSMVIAALCRFAVSLCETGSGMPRFTPSLVLRHRD